MKQSIFTPFMVLVFLIFCLNANSQNFGNWSDPVPMTDSLSDNTNPFIKKKSANGNVLWMVWEKSTDSASTAIYFDNLLDAQTEELVIHTNGVHYTNPQILTIEYAWSISDTTFLLLFETDEEGVKDIHCMAYLNDGSFTSAVPLIDSQYDDDQLVVSQLDYKVNLQYRMNAFCWIRNGTLCTMKIYFDNVYHFSEEHIIDSIACNNPDISQYRYSSSLFVVYEKITDSITILKSCETKKIDTWEDPIVFYDETDSRNPTISLIDNWPCWSAFIDSSWRIVIQNTENNPFSISIANLESDYPYTPTAIGEIPTMYPFLNLAASHTDSASTEIFLSESYGSLDLLNFTNSGTFNRNPRFFEGERTSQYCWYNYLVWESYRNDRWQLFFSKGIMCLLNIEKIHSDEINYKIHPNPTQGKIYLSGSGKQINEISIFNINGKLLFREYEPEKEVNVSDLPSGLYILKIKSDMGVESHKFVKD